MKNKRIKNRINNFSKKNCKAAMEMSVGTIVTIVLLMSVLVLGIVLTKSIFESSKGAIDMTDQQLQSEISKLFAEEKDLVIYPTSGKITIKGGERDQIVVGIRNSADFTDVSTEFTYEVLVSGNDCGLNKEEVENWISIKPEEIIQIPIGGFEKSRINFKIPEGTPNCLGEFRVTVKRGSKIYDSELFSVEVKA